jgi:hypothetical protein
MIMVLYKRKKFGIINLLLKRLQTSYVSCCWKLAAEQTALVEFGKAKTTVSERLKFVIVLFLTFILMELNVLKEITKIRKK